MQMHLFGYILFAAVLSGGCPSADGSLFGDLMAFFTPYRHNWPQKNHEKITQVRGWARDEVCIPFLGCFNMDEPWRFISIELPPPSLPRDIPIEVTLRTRENKTEEYTITAYPNIDLGGAPYNGSNPTVVIFDGFHSNEDEPHLQDLCDAYLTKVNANVMVVDWNPASTEWLYVKALSNARVVARIIARLLSHFQTNYGLNRDDIHVIGHGLGIHTASLLCKEFHGIGRLTALNPSQPFLENLHPGARLNTEDAKFVDVIHTNSKPFTELTRPALTHPMGKVDFYMNGGLTQPGCGISENIANHTTTSVSYANDMKSCNHIRAVRYFTEALRESDKCMFWGHKILFDELSAAARDSNRTGYVDNYTSKPCTNDICLPLGLHTQQYPARGVFIVKTRNKSPYCFQENGIPDTVPK